MPIDAKSETIFTLTDAPEKAMALLGRRMAVSTFYRWAKVGVRGIRLESRFLGGVRYTSEEALSRFFDAVTFQTEGASTIPQQRLPMPSVPARLDDLAQIDCELEAEGL